MAAAEIRSPGVGTVLEVLVRAGATVGAGDEVVVIESMKMEIPVTAPGPGTVLTLHVEVGARVTERQLLVTLG